MLFNLMIKKTALRYNLQFDYLIYLSVGCINKISFEDVSTPYLPVPFDRKTYEDSA